MFYLYIYSNSFNLSNIFTIANVSKAQYLSIFFLNLSSSSLDKLDNDRYASEAWTRSELYSRPRFLP